MVPAGTRVEVFIELPFLTGTVTHRCWAEGSLAAAAAAAGPSSTGVEVNVTVSVALSSPPVQQVLPRRSACDLFVKHAMLQVLPVLMHERFPRHICAVEHTAQPPLLSCRSVMATLLW